MKMLKKLAALILAATMVLVLFTACGDGGGTGTREPEKEAKAFATFSKNDRVAADARVNDPQLQAVAEKHLDEDLQAKVDFFGAKFFGKVHVDGKEEENLTITVTAKYEYGPLVSGILSEMKRNSERNSPAPTSTWMARAAGLSWVSWSRATAATATWQWRSRLETPTTASNLNLFLPPERG